MSYKHLEWAWSVDLPLLEKSVFVCLAHHAHKDTNLAFPSRDRIMQLTGVSRTSLYRALASLEKRKLIQKRAEGRWVITIGDVSHGDSDVSYGDEKYHTETEMFHHETHNSKGIEMNDNEKAQSASKPKMKPSSVKDLLSYVEERKEGEKDRKMSKSKTGLAYMFKEWVQEHHGVALCALTGKDHGMLSMYQQKVGEQAQDYLKRVIVEWDDFRVFLKAMTGTYYEAQVPQLAIIVKQATFVRGYCEKAVEADLKVVAAMPVSTKKKVVEVQVVEDTGSFNFD